MSLAAFIKHDLKYRLISNKNVPDKLTLSSISEHYGVSMTPVRMAINDLITEGIFRKGPNGRLILDHTHVPSEVSGEIVKWPLTTDDWNRTLLKDIMIASLGQKAVYLREEALAQEHNVGRAVIRQTFNRLAGSGLLEHIPRCGWLVPPLLKENVHAYLDIREVLELKALDSARTHLKSDVLEDMLDENKPVPNNGQPRMNDSLHVYWIDTCGNPYIQGFFRQHVADYYTLLFEHAAPTASEVAEMAEQHRKIIQALLEGRWARARHTLSDHIWTLEYILIKLLK